MGESLSDEPDMSEMQIGVDGVVMNQDGSEYVPPVPIETQRSWLFFWLAALLATSPLLVQYLIWLWQTDHYQYVPIAMVSVAILAWSRSDAVVYPPSGWFAWGLLGLGAVLSLVAIGFFSPWASAAAFVMIAAAWLWVSREPDGRRLFGLALPLAMMVRIPLNLDEILVVSLQRWTTRLASSMLDLIWIPHFVSGNVIGLSNRELFVAEACSGIQSVFTILFMASLLIAFYRYPLWYAPIYWLAAIMIAVLGNALRVAIVAVADAVLGVDWTAGWSHEAVGYLTLFISFVLLLSFDQLFIFWLHPIQSVLADLNLRENPFVRFYDNWIVGLSPEDILTDDQIEDEPDDGARRQANGLGNTAANRPIWAFSGRWRFVPLWIGAALFLASFFPIGGYYSRKATAESRETRAASYVPADDLLGNQLGKLSVLGHEIARDSGEQRLGKAADIWTIGNERVKGQLVLSQPYFGWHELCFCYQNVDWELVDRAIVTSESTRANGGAAGSPEYALARFRGADNRYGYLWFSAIDYAGVAVGPPPGLGTLSRLNQFAIRFGEQEQDRKDLMMLQLWLESPRRLEPEEVQVFRLGFELARDRVSRAVANSKGDGGSTVSTAKHQLSVTEVSK